MNWFSASGSSAYEQQFIKDLEENYTIVQRHDPNLDIFSKRRSFLFFLYSMPSTEGGPGIGNHFRPWDFFEWYSKFPHVLRPFGNREQNNHLLFTGHDSRRTKIPRFRVFTEDLSWWMYNAKDLFAETEFPCKFFNCTLCIETGVRCRWCKKYDYRKRCGFCREGMTQHTGYLAWYNMWAPGGRVPLLGRVKSAVSK